ncbi:MAG TPA: lipopolysaccharide heptosyltransferase II [Kiritimatiellia bacterium]|jgi:heptosyltransferase-2
MSDTATNRTGPRYLVCGTNWLGDAVMSMPALQAFRRAAPQAEVIMLVKPPLADLWRMHSAVDRVEVYDDTFNGARAAAAQLRHADLARAYVFPNSFRSALVPFLARVPERVGAAGHWRRAMLTDIVAFKRSSLRRHQAFEYFDILGLETAGFEVPRLTVPLEAIEAAGSLVGGQGSLRIGLFPGAARGPAKRWPATNFSRLGGRFARERGASVAIFGAGSEEGLCSEVARDIGESAINLAGRTSLPVLAATLRTCNLVICNDSGGMHLAAAVGTPVLAIYGLTDPSRTGPLGTHRRIVKAEAPASRDIARTSAAAVTALASVDPDRVYDAALECLEMFKKKSVVSA